MSEIHTNSTLYQFTVVYTLAINFSIADDVELIISPRYGPLLGGQTVKVQGPCFEDFRNIECIFGDIEVRGIYIREDLVICVSPMLILPERVEFALKSDRRVFYGPIYTTCELYFVYAENPYVIL